MTQRRTRRPTGLTPTRAIAARLREVRKGQGMSAQVLAERCAAAGMPSLDRATIANIENHRRARIGVDELLVLAYALDIAPLHLMIPADDQPYLVTPTTARSSSDARAWVRGIHSMSPAMSQGHALYFFQMPHEERPLPHPDQQDLFADMKKQWAEETAAEKGRSHGK